MKFKYIWKGHTIVKFEDERFIVEENKTLDIKCDDNFADFLSKNNFITVKMEDQTGNEAKKETKKETKKQKKARLARLAKEVEEVEETK